MSIGFATSGRTESFLYTILPTSLGVLIVSISGVTDIFVGISVLGLSSSIGSMFLYTTRPEGGKASIYSQSLNTS